MANIKRVPYGYKGDLPEDEVTTSPPEPGEDEFDTSSASLTPLEQTWKKRYGDLRTFSNTLTERINNLEKQLETAKRKDFQIPSTQAEVHEFSKQYPDTYRHIRAIAMQELIEEKDALETETKSVREDLEKIKKERGYAKIKAAHSDFDTLNISQEFHEWANLQPKQIQDWVFESDDPDLCIKALDLYKSETNFKKLFANANKRNPKGADLQVNPKGQNVRLDVKSSDGLKIWRASEIAKLHPSLFEKYESEIEMAREEGRINYNA